MTDRDRLIELVNKAKKEYANDVTDHTEIDYIVECLLNEGVIVPPCKVGDKVWLLVKGFDFPFKAKVNKLVIQQTGVVMSCGLKGYYSASCMITDFGKTVFLTKEEAEAKLKELG